MAKERSPAAAIVQDLHHTLLADLITGYFGNDGKLCNNAVRWKMHFRRYCPHPTQFNCSILENFHYLEQKGLLRVGKYEVLKDLFRRVDTTALRDIKLTAEMIENIKATPIENKDGKECIAEITVNFGKGSKPIDKLIMEVLIDFINRLDYCHTPLSARFRGQDYDHTLLLPTEMSLRIINGESSTDQYEALRTVINETLDKIDRALYLHIKDRNKLCKKIIHCILTLLDRMKKNYKVKRWQFHSKSTVIVYVEFYTAFNFKTCLGGNGLTEEIASAFHFMFSHVNDPQLNTPYVQIKELAAEK